MPLRRRKETGTVSDLRTEINRRRTFAIISHPDAGKTTLTEKFLLYGGAINLAGSVKGKAKRDERVKNMMAEKIKRLQEEKEVTTYRICKDLGLNNANVNHWLKNGCNGKVSMSTARRVLQYMDSYFAVQS